MITVIRKNYNASSSFAEALEKIINDLNSEGKPYSVLHVENEKRFTVRATRGDIPYRELIGGIAVVLVEIR